MKGIDLFRKVYGNEIEEGTTATFIDNDGHKVECTYTEGNFLTNNDEKANILVKYGFMALTETMFEVIPPAKEEAAE